VTPPRFSALIPRLALPRRLAAITAIMAVVLVVGTTEAALRLAERSRLVDLREESVDLANTLAAWLTRIAPTGDPGALHVALTGWNRRHITETSAVVYLVREHGVEQAVSGDSAPPPPQSAIDSAALSRRQTLTAYQSSDPRGWHVAVPLTGRSLYGVLDITVTAGRLEQWARVERRRAYALALVAALLVGVGVWVLCGRWIGRPLASLAGAMAAAHGGAESAPAAPLVGPVEFQDLAGRYNELRAALAARERESRARAGLRGLEERARALDRQGQADEIARSYAHEIGTPLSTVNGHLQLLREDFRRTGDTAAEERVNVLLGQVDRVAKIVRGALSRTSWPAPQPVPTDLVALGHRLMQFLAPTLEQSGIGAVLVSAGPGTAQVRTDPDLVEQILLNLFRNAVEALGSGGRIELRVALEGDHAVIEVADDGPGLSLEARALLFQPFATSKGSAGTGLGLALSRRLARLLGGDLTHVPGDQGTRWRLTLPPEPPA